MPEIFVMYKLFEQENKTNTKFINLLSKNTHSLEKAKKKAEKHLIQENCRTICMNWVSKAKKSVNLFSVYMK